MRHERRIARLERAVEARKPPPTCPTCGGGAEASQRALCCVCCGLGRYNARTFTNGVPDRDEPPEPCPGCGEVRLMHIHLTVRERITATPQPLVVVGDVGGVGGGEAA